MQTNKYNKRKNRKERVQNKYFSLMWREQLQGPGQCDRLRAPAAFCDSLRFKSQRKEHGKRTEFLFS